MKERTSCHQDGRSDHQLLVSASEYGQRPENDNGTGKNRKSDWDTTDSDADWVMAVDIKGLGWPEHDDREEIGTGDEGDDESEGENARCLL